MDDTEASELAELLETLRKAVTDENDENIELAIQTIKKIPTQNKNWLLSEVATEKRLVELLLDNGADVDAGVGDGEVTPLARAAWYNYHEVVKLLIKHEARVNTVDQSQKTTVLEMAVYDGYTETVKLLLDNGADPNASVGDGETPLARAVLRGDKELVVLLLEKGVNPNTGANGKETPLANAALRGDKEIVELLLSKKADPNGGEVKPVAGAAWLDYHEVLALLIAGGASVDTMDRMQNMTVLTRAVYDGYERTVKLLVENGANIDALSSESGDTALQMAVRMGYKNIVDLLIKKRANIHGQVPEGGRTVLQEGVYAGNLEIVELLVDSTATVKAIELQAAVKMSNLKMVELLIAKVDEIDATAGAKHGVTALRMAIGEDEEDLTIEDEEQEGETQEGSEAGSSGVGGSGSGGGGEGGVGREQEEEKERLDKDKEEKKEMDSGEEKESDRVKIVKILLAKGASVHGTKGESGQNILHSMCLRRSQEDFDLFDLLLEKSTAKEFNARDASGSTPLHFAVRRKNLTVVKRLIKKRVSLQTEDNSGKTALQAGFQEWLKNTPKDSSINTPQPAACTLGDILKILLENGARTDGLELKDIERLRVLGHNESSKDIVMLHDNLSHGTHISDIECLNLRRKFRSPSICFRRTPLSPQPCTKSPPNIGSSTKTDEVPKRQTRKGPVRLPLSFVHPNSFLKRCWDFDSDTSGVHWAWSTVTNRGMSFRPRIPDLQNIISLMPVEVILIGYVCFECPMQPTTDPTNPAVIPIQSFEFENKMVEISWIMKQERGSNFLRSVQYRGSMDLKYLAIPQNAVHFVTLFFGDIHERWKKVLGSAKEYLVSRRDSQLHDAGQDHDTISLLLQDSKKWSKLRKVWKTNFECARKLRDQLRESDILFPEVKNPWQFRKEHESTTETQKGKDVVKRVPGGSERVNFIEEQPKSMPTSNPNTAGPIAVTTETPVPEQKARLPEDGEANKGPELEGTTDQPSLEQKARGAIAEEPLIPTARRQGTLRLEVVEGDKQKGPRSPVQPKTGVPNIDRDEAKKNALKEQKSEKPKEGQEKPKENELNILTPVQAAKLPDMKRLSEAFDALVKECEDGIAELEKETTDMIQLEFNLISIYEARRSIETSVSMKRLSWITFIFLPLMFITGVFGMNVNLFQSEAPRWQWYFVVVVPFSLLVLSVWILCKYLPGVGNLEKRLDKFLKNVFDRCESKAEIRQGPTVQSLQRETITRAQASKGARPLKKALGSRLPRWRRNKGLDPESGNGSTAVTEEHIEEKK